MNLTEHNVRVEIPEEQSIYTEYARDKCRYIEYMYKGSYEFEKRKIYGILGESGEGGGGLTWLLSGKYVLGNENVTVFGKKYQKGETIKEGWHMSEGIPDMNRQAWKILSSARKRSGSKLSMPEIMEKFQISEEMVNQKIKENKWDVWRLSAAIGYILGKKIFCFPSLPTLFLKEIVMYTGFFNYVEKLKTEGCILLLPSGNGEILESITDEIIEIDHPRFKGSSLLFDLADAYKKGNLFYQQAVDD